MIISDDIKIIRELLNISQQDLADDIGIPFEEINRWENNVVVPERSNIDLLYSYAYSKKIFINRIHEIMLKEEHTTLNNVVLFHSAKKEIVGDIDLLHSKKSNDFGAGFYLSENFEQAATYIAYSDSYRIYSYELDQSDLKILKFDVNTEWMFCIAYYRGWLDNYKDRKVIKEIVEKVEKADLIIAPIADNRMFALIDEFVSGIITDEQCKYALSATNLGYQYVIKKDSALLKINFLEEMFLCGAEKLDYISKRLDESKVGMDKVKLARIKYKNKGKYIEEILK